MSAVLTPLAPAKGCGRALEINGDATRLMRNRDQIRRNLARVIAAKELIEKVTETSKLIRAEEDLALFEDELTDALRAAELRCWQEGADV